MTQQPNEPTAEAMMTHIVDFSITEADRRKAQTPRSVGMDDIMLYALSETVTALRAENERLIKAHGLVWNAVLRAAAAFRWLAIPEQAHGELREDADRIFAAEKCKPDWSTDWEIVSRIDITQLRASLSTAVDALDKIECMCGEDFHECDPFGNIEEVTVAALAQLRPLLAGKPPAAEVKAEERLTRIREYVAGRRRTIQSQVASEFIGGNEFKLACERTALAEITAMECELANLGSAQAGKGGAK